MPTARVVVEKDAPAPESGTVTSRMPPSLKVTLPVGVPEAALTVALKVTFWPNTDGFRVETTVVEVESGDTTCVRGAEALLA